MILTLDTLTVAMKDIFKRLIFRYHNSCFMGFKLQKSQLKENTQFILSVAIYKNSYIAHDKILQKQNKIISKKYLFPNFIH
jgi:hypothetical protein